MNDEVVQIPSNSGKFYVLNLQNSWQDGSHWVLLSCLDRQIFYFDPYGYPPTKEVTQWIQRTGRPCIFSEIDEQTYSSEACGYYCIFVAKHLLAGASPGDGDLMRLTEKNRKIVEGRPAVASTSASSASVVVTISFPVSLTAFPSAILPAPTVSI